MSVCLRSRELLAIFALRMIGGRSKGEMSVRWMSLLSFCSLSLSLSLSFAFVFCLVYTHLRVFSVRVALIQVRERERPKPLSR